MNYTADKYYAAHTFNRDKTELVPLKPFSTFFEDLLIMGLLLALLLAVL